MISIDKKVWLLHHYLYRKRISNYQEKLLFLFKNFSTVYYTTYQQQHCALDILHIIVINKMSIYSNHIIIYQIFKYKHTC